ncbi:50S ribosomal protein L18 [secondary endosymbiont of Trabutina mannipara]|uniref:Large ribosomal subunit protein uL18 n=1 Tax=secondary endosymbiont of Trabutina mannipara TaxID=1835721 RepID=A0A1C3L494_9ENTR|nr:50S ribosomal protein L18 [secondary endosymbiont of Trabutina mannipara]SBT82097.1 50S ribosomal protein L18 [secondary endosymbiont of Trabutina mannipara]
MNKKIARIRRSIRTKSKIKKLGSMRLVIHRTLRHIYAHIFEPTSYKILVAASTVEKNILEINVTGNKYAASEIGRTIAIRALEKGIKKVSFDRSGFKYHGRVQALANAARIAGLQF